MKALKYILYGLGTLLALSNIGGMVQGFGAPILWILMAIFFVVGYNIQLDKKV